MFKILSHTADIALDVRAANLESLFTEASRGWKEMVFEDSETRPAKTRSVRLASPEAEDLLVQWLSELNYFLTVRQWVFHQTEQFSLHGAAGEWTLDARISGERLDPQRHYIYFDIKAVTYHQLKIEQTGGEFRVQIVFDI
ncbi:MAG: archease [Calditrichaceae bacterium]|nr:archease [Calditrichia bacterium]NUQ43959.1 archease [Calditrichaceae bacterium]